MKVNILDAHDRYTKFTNQNFNIGECCQDLIDKRPYGDHAFYIFAHARTDEDGVTKRMIWQPRLTRPKAQTNSMLFKAYPGTDIVKIIWMIPVRELWNQFKQGLITENKIISESIYKFENKRSELEADDEDDLSNTEIDAIYRDISISCQKTTRG